MEGVDESGIEKQVKRVLGDEKAELRTIVPPIHSTKDIGRGNGKGD
jgi:hypothetical protein